MAGSVNKVILIGHLGGDPEIHNLSGGDRACNLRLATNETWKDRATGERQERTQWHSVTIYSEPLIRTAEQYLRKGSKIYVEGQIETRKWQDQSGQDRYRTEVILRPWRSVLLMVDRRDSGDDHGYGVGTSDSGSGYADSGFDDEIPF